MREAALDKKGEGFVALDVGNRTILADTFAIVTGRSKIQTRAIADAIVEAVRKDGYTVSRIEGYADGSWILIDLGNVIAHVFTPEQRSFYNLERLWGPFDYAQPFDSAQGDTVKPFDYAQGDTVKPFDYAQGDTDKPFDSAQGDTVKPFDYAQGDTVRPFDSAQGDTVKPFDSAQGDKRSELVPQLRLHEVREVPVQLRGGEPAVVDRQAVRQCAGPWRIAERSHSDCAEGRDEYDVVLESGTFARIYRQGSHWYFRGIYE